MCSGQIVIPKRVAWNLLERLPINLNQFRSKISPAVIFKM